MVVRFLRATREFLCSRFQKLFFTPSIDATTQQGLLSTNQSTAAAPTKKAGLSSALSALGPGLIASLLGSCVIRCFRDEETDPEEPMPIPVQATQTCHMLQAGARQWRECRFHPPGTEGAGAEGIGSCHLLA